LHFFDFFCHNCANSHQKVGFVVTNHAAAEIKSQPEIWQRVIALHPQVAELLPKNGERVAFVGCGTSWFVSMAISAMREASGLGESDAFTASEYPFNRNYDRVVAITRSGTTTEVIDLLRSLDSVPSVVITAVADSPVTKLADSTILLDFADEESVLQTRYATSVITLLRTHFGQDMTKAIGETREMLALELDPELVAAEQIAFLGTGWTIGLAQEAALKTRESSQFWAEAYPAMDYRHGPISIAQKGRAVWMLGDWPAGLEADVRATGAKVIAFDADPLAQLVLAQRVAIAIAASRGLDANSPRNLSRSIVLH
jgi:fructoselysine-6-P-deglycase FrlB-like protein